MAFRRGDWPLTIKQLQTVLSHGETRLVEFKRQWPSLADNDGKAKVAREVIALANTVGPDELALLVFGVDDERRGGAIFPVADAPQPEALSQILADYAHPAVTLEYREYSLPDGKISVICIMHSATRPHYCIREAAGVLTTRDVYVRRDKQVGVLMPPELEAMIREKAGFAEAVTDRQTVEFGFLTMPSLRSDPFTLQVRNLTTDPLTDVWITIDFRSVRDPSLCYRFRPLNNFTLPPGKAHEVSVSSSQLQFYKVYWLLEPVPADQLFGRPPRNQYVRHFEHLRDHSSTGDGWLDVEAVLTFRGFNGLLTTQHTSMRVDLG